MNEYDDFITTAQVAATVLDELSSHTTILHDALKELPELLENTPPEEKMLWKNIGRFSTTGSQIAYIHLHPVTSPTPSSTSNPAPKHQRARFSTKVCNKKSPN